MEDAATSRLAEAVRGGAGQGGGWVAGGRGGAAGAGGGGGWGRAAGLGRRGDVPEPWERRDCVQRVANVSEQRTRTERVRGKGMRGCRKKMGEGGV